MFADPDRGVLLAVALLVGLLVLAALGVWARDRRLARRSGQSEPLAVPLPVPESAPPPRHALSGESLPWTAAEAGGAPQDAAGSDPATRPERSTASRDADRATAEACRSRAPGNVTVRGLGAGGPTVAALARALAALARVLPGHTFTLTAAPGLDDLCVEEPGFTLACCALVLHAAQSGSTHTIGVRPMTPRDPLYPLGLLSSVIVEIRTPPGLIPADACLAERALDACERAGGAGSIADETKLWLAWPARKKVLAAALLATAAPIAAHA